MSSDQPRFISRRHFVQWCAAGAAVLGLDASSRFHGPSVSAAEPILPEARLLAGSFSVLSPYEATVLDEVSALLIPTDQDPGARDAQVVRRLDQWLGTDAEGREVYRQGIAWVDLYAAELYGQDSFLTVPIDGRIRILELAESGRVGRVQKLKEWWTLGSWGQGTRFFERARRDVFTLFYAAPEGWRVAGYQGPPQFGGYPGFTRCR